MFRVGKIDEDTVDCPRFVAFKGASREDSSSSLNLGQLTKRIHGESNEFDEEEARQAQRKDRRRRAPFYLESPIGFTFTWNRPLCAVLMLLGGGGAHCPLPTCIYGGTPYHSEFGKWLLAFFFLSIFNKKNFLNDPDRFIFEPDWAADPDRFIIEPDWFVDVSDRVVIFRTEPGLHDSIPRFQFFSAFPTHQSLNF